MSVNLTFNYQRKSLNELLQRVPLQIPPLGSCSIANIYRQIVNDYTDLHVIIPMLNKCQPLTFQFQV